MLTVFYWTSYSFAEYFQFYYFKLDRVRIEMFIVVVVSAGGWRGERRSSRISWGKEGEGPQSSSQSAGGPDG